MKRKKILILLIIITLLNGCSMGGVNGPDIDGADSTPISPSITPSPSVQATQSSVGHVPVTPTPTQTAEQIATRIPMIINDESCVYPCLAGIVPGTTTMDEANGILRPIAAQITRNHINQGTPKEIDHYIITNPVSGDLINDYLVVASAEGDILVVLSRTQESMQSIFEQYGSPDEVLFWAEEFDPVYDLILDYSSQSFILEWMGQYELTKIDSDYYVQTCIDGKNRSLASSTWVFSAAQIPDVQSLDAVHHLPVPLDGYRHLSDISDLSVADFYDGILNQGEVCIHSDFDQWK